MTSLAQLLRDSSRRITSRFGFADREMVDAPPKEIATGDSTPHRPRILILSASVGSGHIRAAKAIESCLAAILPDATIAHVDILQLTNAAFRRFYGRGYFDVAQYAPHVVGYMYDALDKAGEQNASGISPRMILQRANFKRLTQFLSNFSWDLAINTHFLSPEMIAWLRRSGKIDFPQVTVVTDYDAHGMWVNHPTDQYFVATDEVRASLLAQGVKNDAVSVTGIPIDPNFMQRRSVVECRRKHGLAIDKPVVLQMGGGAGIGSVEEIYRSIRAVEQSLQIVVVAGKNESARAACEALGAHSHHACKVLGYTTDMHELMAAADVVISKPGGLTTSESLACGCPMIVVEPIPGQEDRNSDFLLESGCGIKVNSLSVLTYKLQALLADPARVQKMRECAFKYAKPRAAMEIANQCVELLRSRSTGR